MPVIPKAFFRAHFFLFEHEKDSMLQSTESLQRQLLGMSVHSVLELPQTPRL